MLSKILELRFKSRFPIAWAVLWGLIIAVAQTAGAQEPPREVPLVEKKWEDLANRDVSESGRKALDINPDKWRHAETENFIVHYRRLTEARKVAREIEYDLWFVAKNLNAGKDRYSRKSHVYVFEDEDEWKAFLPQTDAKGWSASFAIGDELFLNVRKAQDTGRFDSQTLAHETTHAVVARLYPQKRWPLWLNEGFAEYMGGASVAARKGQTVKRFQQSLDLAQMSLDQLQNLQEYPRGEAEVRQLYQTAEKLVRYLMNQLPKERFPAFVDCLLDGSKLEAALVATYSDKVKDFATFKKKYAEFAR